MEEAPSGQSAHLPLQTTPHPASATVVLGRYAAFPGYDCFGVSDRRTNAGSICLPTSTIPHGESTEMQRVVRIPASRTESIRRRAILRRTSLGLRSMKAVATSTFLGSVATGRIGVNLTR